MSLLDDLENQETTETIEKAKGGGAGIRSPDREITTAPYIEMSADRPLAKEISMDEAGAMVVKVDAMKEALADEKLRRQLTKGQAKRLRNETTADVIDSAAKVNSNKEVAEGTLFKRYEYVFSMLGISKQLPSFMCVIVLAIYSVLGTLLTLTFGSVFIVVNFVIDGVRGIFGRLTLLFRETQGLAKGLACSSVFLLLAGIVAVVVLLIIKYAILI